MTTINDDPFISTVELGLYLRADMTDDEMAVIAANAACQLIRSYINQDINAVEDDEVALDGSGTRTMLLPQLPVIDVTAVSLLNDYNEDVEALETTDWRLTNAGLLWMASTARCWPHGRANVLVTYSHGYATLEADEDDPFPGVPDDIRLVALEQAASIYTAGTVGTVGTGGVSSETIGSYSYSVDTVATGGTLTAGTLTSDMRRTLGKYRRV